MMNAHWGVVVIYTFILILTLDEGEWLASRLNCFTLGIELQYVYCGTLIGFRSFFDPLGNLRSQRTMSLNTTRPSTIFYRLLLN
jgi:hypothetical protein